jgi:hypothetical protein
MDEDVLCPFLGSLHVSIGCGNQPNIRFKPTSTTPLCYVVAAA